MSINVSAINSAAIASGGSSGVAQLQAKLKELFNKVKDLAKESDIDPKLKKMMQQSLQAQIQLVSKQIADVQAKSAKRALPDVHSSQLDKESVKSKKDHEQVSIPRRSGIDTFA